MYYAQYFNFSRLIIFYTVTKQNHNRSILFLLKYRTKSKNKNTCIIRLLPTADFYGCPHNPFSNNKLKKKGEYNKLKIHNSHHKVKVGVSWPLGGRWTQYSQAMFPHRTHITKTWRTSITRSTHSHLLIMAINIINLYSVWVYYMILALDLLW